MNADSTIPLIDFNQFLNGSVDDRKDVASTIDAAFRSVGFIYLSNHGIDDDKVNECFRWVSPRYFLNVTHRGGEVFLGFSTPYLPFLRRPPFLDFLELLPLGHLVATIIANKFPCPEQPLLCPF